MYKNILLFKNEYSKTYNKEFNEKMKSVSDQIFQTEQIFPAGYIPIGTYVKEQVEYSAIRNPHQNIVQPTNNEQIDSTWEVLSEYEKIIASHLLYGTYNAYIFSGGMGSGKTSTATHVLGFIKEKYSTPNSAFIKIEFDFNLGVVDENENNGKGIIERFTQELYTKLRVAISTHIKKNNQDIVRKLWSFIEVIEFDKYSEFFDLGKIVNSIAWLDLTNAKRAEEFIAFIENTTQDKISRIEMLMKFLRFLNNDLKEKEFIIIFYDNIDILKPALQQKLFHDYILPLNTIAATKCLISLRRTTFLRAFDYSDIRFAQSFGFIHHHGHHVSEIIFQRLSYWKVKIGSDPFFNKLNAKYVEALKGRIKYLQNEFSLSKHPYSLRNYIDALSGNCVRLGLYISHRLLINNIIRYDESPLQRDRYKKALIVNLENNILLSNFEELVNMFTVNDSFSLLPIKILHLINNTKAQSGVKIKDIISNFLHYSSQDDIIETIKILLFSRRPLLWIDTMDSSPNLDLTASLFITEIGHGYLNYLIEDLTYVQECLMVAKWDSDIIPLSVDIQNEYERLSTIIKCLRVAFDEEFHNFSSLSNKITSSLITLKIIDKILNTIITLNYSTGYRLLVLDIEELLTYILNSKAVESIELSEMLSKVQKLIV